MVLDRELAAALGNRVVAIERVVRKGGIVQAAIGALRAADHDAADMAVVEDVVPHGDVAGDFSLPLAARGEAVVAIVDVVALDQDVTAAIDIEAGRAAGVVVATRVEIAAVGWVELGIDSIDRV